MQRNALNILLAGATARFDELLARSLVGLLCGGASPALAEVVAEPCASIMDPNNAPVVDARLQHLTVDGTKVNVLLPPAYGRSVHPYPVLYLFHGAFGDQDSFSTQTDLLDFTASLPDFEQVVVVMPDGGHLPAGRDWEDGTHDQESFVIDRLLPYVEAHYFVGSERSQRAAAGFSAGGMNAMVLAARHPDSFAAAGSFSGFVDPMAPEGQAVVQQFADLDRALCGATEEWRDIWGDPVAHPMGWEGHDPVYLAENLSHTALYLAARSGSACPGEPPADPFLGEAEAIANGMALKFHQALQEASVPHVLDVGDCGIHAFSNSNLGLRRFWPQMLLAFHRLPPRTFDYANADSQFEAWGWAFVADPLRAPEFLRVNEASRLGLSLTGSGLITVTTAALFLPGRLVRVSDNFAGTELARAGRDGRLTFTVDLGPAHPYEQDTPAAQAAAEASPPYFTTRTIRLR